MKTFGTDAVSGFLKYDENWKSGHGPLSKREYFSALAMQGELAAQSSDLGEYSTDCSIERLAENSVKIADALIKALNKDAENE